MRIPRLIYQNIRFPFRSDIMNTDIEKLLIKNAKQNVANKAHWACRSLDVEQQMLLIHH